MLLAMYNTQPFLTVILVITAIYIPCITIEHIVFYITRANTHAKIIEVEGASKEALKKVVEESNEK